MRRPYRLHRGPCEEELLLPLDFGLKATVYVVPEIQSRQIATLSFIWLCKLSEIMAAIAVFQQRTRFSREWNGESIGSSISELDEVIVFDREIRKWKDDFETDVLEVIGDHSVKDNEDVPIPVSILRIVCK